jgi:hypothetical protein
MISRMKESCVSMYSLGQLHRQIHGSDPALMFDRMPGSDMIVVWDGTKFKNIDIDAERFEVPFVVTLPNLADILKYSPDLTTLHILATTLEPRKGIWIEI